jgi:hypothetical protein
MYEHRLLLAKGKYVVFCSDVKELSEGDHIVCAEHNVIYKVSYIEDNQAYGSVVSNNKDRVHVARNYMIPARH